MTPAEKQTEEERARYLAEQIGGALVIILGLRSHDRQVEWDAGRGRFRIGGRLVTIAAVRKVLDRLETQVGIRMAALAKDLEAGRIGLDDWTRRMKDLVGSAHYLNAALANGSIGTAVGAPAVIRRVDRELKYLEGFAGDLKKKPKSSQSVTARATSYLLAAAATYAVVEQTVRKAIGFTECRRILRARESCSDCQAIAYEWMPIEKSPPIGSLACGSRCRCYLEYR
ncbi:MAG: hypothetical protein AB7P97_21585 [Hyphomonadaceae bacterium]